MTKGIIITAVNHPYYGRMAYNLALTIKAVSDMPIALVTDSEGLRGITGTRLSIFDEIIPKDGRAIDTRLWLPEITPFDMTLAIDADLLWLSKTPDELFDLLNDSDFTCVNEGFLDIETQDNQTSKIYTWWANPDDIIKAYKLKGKFYQFRGEFVLFKNTDAVKKMYKIARTIYKKPKTENRAHGGDITDEYCLNIAANLAGIEPHLSVWEPAYWPGRHGNIIKDIPLLRNEYFALSAGGNTATVQQKRQYNILTSAAANKLNVLPGYSLVAKKEVLKNRINS